MRIALVSTCALATPPKAYGGTELVVAELAKGLCRSGHDVTLFATGDSQTEGTLRSHFAGPVWPPNDLAELNHAAHAWRQIARANRPFDVVHVHHHTALPFQALVGVPTVYTVHHARSEALVQHYVTYPDVTYVAISERQAVLTPEVRFARVIHHGLDVARYSLGTGGGGHVAYLGRLAEEKGSHLAIDAARKAGATIRLGGAAHDEARAFFARELKPRLSQPGVHWEGELSQEPKLELLRGARALLVPVQWEEPFGLVMIEAMLVGTPVIALARGSVPEIVEEGITGFLARDVDEMAERIRELPGFDRARCRQRAVARFSHSRMARDYADLYQALLGRQPLAEPRKPRKERERGGELATVVPITPERRARREARQRENELALRTKGDGTSEEPWK